FSRTPWPSRITSGPRPASSAIEVKGCRRVRRASSSSVSAISCLVSVPIGRCAAPEHGAELLGRFREHGLRAPVADHPLVPDDVEYVDLVAEKPLPHALGFLLEPPATALPDPLALPLRCLEIELVLADLRIDRPNDDAVVLVRPLDAHVAVDDVLQHALRISL